jgi:hypothetical protein
MRSFTYNVNLTFRQYDHTQTLTYVKIYLDVLFLHITK